MSVQSTPRPKWSFDGIGHRLASENNCDDRRRGARDPGGGEVGLVPEQGDRVRVERQRVGAALELGRRGAGPGKASFAIASVLYHERSLSRSAVPSPASSAVQAMSERSTSGGSPAAAAARNFCSKSEYGTLMFFTLMFGYSFSNFGMIWCSITVISVPVYALRKVSDAELLACAFRGETPHPPRPSSPPYRRREKRSRPLRRPTTPCRAFFSCCSLSPCCCFH